ncbi:metalloregulator ArsR/SmtB family transcription factor [Fredinandcohnia quinoae]|uniref:Metalloregulator ArsR/SmtB family transcription factor n=1 Tax=Fredinandcohnia quinoae TaxID=2918902 RepID=A0AAW5E4X8_9BACI|nr:metalloregulator ArsR/SmtB family transcription factor [Fredinandcohnia sp. SECRCQ15]
MQLDKLVNFHKVMGDPTRIRILVLLAKGPLHGQALAGKLGVTPPTITHHMTKLRDIGLISERRDKNTIYFRLNDELLKQQTKAITDVILGKETIMEASNKETMERHVLLQNFLTPEGRLKTIPSQKKKRIIILEHIVRGLVIGKKYSEKELNEHIKKYHDDFATIRREFIMNHFMYRENGIYEVNPSEMWMKFE